MDPTIVALICFAVLCGVGLMLAMYPMMVASAFIGFVIVTVFVAGMLVVIQLCRYVAAVLMQNYDRAKR